MGRVHLGHEPKDLWVRNVDLTVEHVLEGGLPVTLSGISQPGGFESFVPVLHGSLRQITQGQNGRFSLQSFEGVRGVFHDLRLTYKLMLANHVAKSINYLRS